MLKVLLDARKLGDGGIGTYIQNLASGLLLDPDVSLSLLVAKGGVGAHFQQQQVPQFEEKSKSYSIDERFFLGSRISGSGQFASTDIFHEPHFTLPGRLKFPSVVTVHDLIQITNPESWYYPIVAKYLVGSAISAAKRIIAVSAATKAVLLKNFPRYENLDSKIVVIPNAVATNFLQESEDWPDLLKSKYDLEPGYLFALFSMLKPHKGFSDLIEAYSRARSHSKLPQLVVAGRGLGGLDSGNTALFDRLKSLNIKSIGEISGQDLAALYKGARATIVPSLVEGFGLSALEAKVLGSRLILRPLPSLSSISDNDDVICRDLSVSALSEALTSFQSKYPDIKENKRNTELAGKFSVSSVAKRTKEVYQEVYLGL